MRKSDKRKIHDNLVNLISAFGDNKDVLVKYLLDNIAFNDNFLSKILSNNKISKVIEVPEFMSIAEINSYYNSLIDDFEGNGESIEELTLNLNNKLNDLINKELFEEAIRVRDYMVKNNINRN